MSYVIGYIGRPTNDGRVVNEVELRAGMVPVLTKDGDQIGSCTAVRIVDGVILADVNWIRGVSAWLLEEGQLSAPGVLSMDLTAVTASFGDGGTRIEHAYLAALHVLPLEEWAWTPS